MQTNDHGFTKFTQQAGIIAFTDFLVKLKGLVLLSLLTKLLGAPDYGIWAQIMVTVGLAVPLIGMGLGSSIIRFLAGEKNKKIIREGIFSSLTASLLVGILLLLLLFTFAGFIAKTLFANPEVTGLIKLSLLLILFSALNQLLFSYFRCFRQTKKYSVLTIIQTLSELGAITYSLLTGYGLMGAIISLLFIRGIIFFITLGLIVAETGLGTPTFSNLKAYLAFGIPLVPTTFLYWMIYSSDRYVIGYFHGVSTVGIYSAACTLAGIIIALSTPIYFVLYPTISKLWEEGKQEEVKINLKYAFKYGVLFGIPAVFGISVFASQLLQLFTTPQFTHAAVAVPWVASGLLILLFGGLGEYVLMLAKRTKVIAAILFCAATLNLILNIILIPQLGILGAAIATFICYTGLGVANLLISSKHLTFEIDIKLIAKSILASLSMVLFIKVTDLGIFLSIVLGILIYLAMLVILKALSHKEINFLKSIFWPAKK